MNRRNFLAASALAGAAPLSALAAPARADEVQFFELRQYQLLYGAKQQQVHDFMKDVAIPAFNRHGVGPVGAFQVVYGPNQPSLYVLLPHPSAASVLSLRRALAADADYVKAGAAFLEPPLADPAYVRIESSLMAAFSHMPKLEVPPQTGAGRSRVFELRIYESHSEPAAQRKIHMFNEGGEIAIFRKTGLTPVFFGETLVGPRLPNLVYMLAFDDLAARDRAWDAFRDDPDWKTLSADPFYKDTVSTITDFILRPTAYSQI